jgi:Ca2+-binding RTX toxin-like protein
MADIFGTAGADEILRNRLSPGVISDPLVTGTLGSANLIFAEAGNDWIEAGDFGDEVHGGTGDDRIFGGLGSDWLHGDAGDDLIVSGDNLPDEFGTAGFVVLDGGTGADYMIGREGQQFFVVDDQRDVVRDTGTIEGDNYDTIVTNLDYTLSETAGIEVLDFAFAEYFGLAARPVVGIGNSHDNILFGNELRNKLYGGDGYDIVTGEDGCDRVFGGRGDDDVQGNAGRDVVRGQDGDDNVWGGSGVDRLVGGRGEDTFFFNYVTDSSAAARDVIAAGDGAIAFQGAGRPGGDLIWMPNDLGPVPNTPLGPFTFGGTGKMQVSCVDRGTDTLVRANVDDDAKFEFRILIEDGAVRADQYTAGDFFLG